MKHYFIQFALATAEQFFFGMLQSVPLFEQNKFFVILGRTFGPPGIRHFSELSGLEQEELKMILPDLNKRHQDWLIFKWLKYWQTLYVGGLPPITEGNTPDQKPIPDRGFWWYSEGFFTLQTLQGIHMRLGFRPEDVWTEQYRRMTGSPLYLFMLSASVKKYS